MDFNRLKNDGFLIVSNFLDIKNRKKIFEIINQYKPQKGSRESFFSINRKDVYSNLLKLNIKKFKEDIYLLNLVKNLKLSEISNRFFGKPSYLCTFDGYYNSVEKNINKEIIPWHTDQAYSGALNIDENRLANPDNFALKFFIYLTDVNEKNGVLSCIPGSHKITYLIRKAIFKNELKYKPYWSLNQIYEFITHNDNLFYFEKHPEYEMFKKKLEIILNDKNKNLFDYSAKAGDALIFNEGVIHRGAMLSDRDRIVLRIHFKPKF